ncbi:unnamed protein product [Allacma fusca]|uniref:Uncharacterized protein n=1 Tax=Allacma fusca TaxID=39272 RepID=A0A8J2JM10_9HEXA|nr:unnamed protein product [Allacma fusca]
MSENFGISSLPEPVQKGVIGMIYSQERLKHMFYDMLNIRNGGAVTQLEGQLERGKESKGSSPKFDRKSCCYSVHGEEFYGKLRILQLFQQKIFREFDYVTLEDYPDSPNKLVRKIESKVKAFANVPDLIPDFFTRSGLTSVTVNYGFNHQYLLGATDQVGYAIPLELGGPAALNFFYENGTGRRPAGIWYSMFRHLAMVASTGMDTSAIKYRLNAEGAVD